MTRLSFYMGIIIMIKIAIIISPSKFQYRPTLVATLHIALQEAALIKKMLAITA